MSVGLLIVTGGLAAFCLSLAARVPAVWAGAPTPLNDVVGISFGKSRRTYLMYTLTMNAVFGGMFLLFLGFELDLAVVWQAGTVLAVLGSPVALLAWIVVAAFNRPRFLVPPDQRLERQD
jgi:hypothetical protein